ncbi:MAG: putative toxin-antitoxin system toxin component, PIN family [Cytophagaceae bacterium]|nr:MAG: putative toxin-antitoxin system toxin component, PIN family [Cytophagaceae bacterium]
MRAVIDTNALLKCIGLKSLFRPIFDSLLLGNYTLVVSTSILYEYEEILGERNGAFITEATLAALLSLDNLIRQRISFDFRLVEQDPDDDKFVNAYVAGQADYLVTDDRHFRVVLASKFPTVRVVSTAEFMEVISRK